MHAKSKPIFTKAYSFGLVSGSSRRNCFLHLPEVAFKVCNSSPSGGIAMFYFGNRRSRESDNRLEAKSDRLLSEQGIDQAQFGYHEEEEVQGCGLTAIPTLNAWPQRFRGQVARLAPKSTRLIGTPRLCLHRAT
jgi:hypothetical protein